MRTAMTRCASSASRSGPAAVTRSTRACAQHEALINVAFAGRRVTILCPYNTANLDPAVLADAAVTHPVLVDHRGEHVSDRYDPYKVVAGYNEPLLAPADAHS